jgi:hypothetical protein
MRTVIRMPARPQVGRTVGLGQRPGNTVVVLGILSLAIPLAIWNGVSSSIVALAALSAGLVLAFVGVRRSLRRASARIDAILREELGKEGRTDRKWGTIASIPTQGSSVVEDRVELDGREGMVDDHRCRAEDAGLVSRAGLDDAQFGGGQRK